MSGKNKNITNELLRKAKAAVKEVEPEAELYLFGSRARGDHNDDSDWDFLVLLPGKIDYDRKSRVYDSLYDIELEYLQIFNVVIYMKDYWFNDDLMRATPFNSNVSRESVKI
jgi:uncharacterized protein